MAPLGFTIDYYAVLQTSENADENTIKACYKRLALTKHPDRNQAPNATAEFQRVQEAYEVLKDPSKRKRFDAQLPHIRREAAARTPFTSKGETNCDFYSQSPQSYEQAIHMLEQKLQGLESENAKLNRDRDTKLQEIYKHRAAIKRLQEQDEQAAKEDAERSTWISFLILNRYTHSEKEQRNRAAALRKSNRRDLEDILRDLQAEGDRLAAKISLLYTEIRQVRVEKRELVEAQSRAQAAAKAKVEKQHREQQRKRQEAEEKARKEREAAEEKARKETEAAKVKAKKEREKELKKTMEELVRKEKEEQESRDRHQQLNWEIEERLRKERDQDARRKGHREALRERMKAEQARKGKEATNSGKPRTGTQRHDQQSTGRHEPEEKDSNNQQKRPSKPKAAEPHLHQTTIPIDVNKSGSCKHRKFWSRIEGRIQCSLCHVTQARFAFRCPGCQMTACASCRDILKNILS
ncbi:hypothetical protein QQS21_008701 [Conoideocrella luteorostrata]|uniref:J domain-containing protein n=1 Tax=Conoideocrella luteorostrata TaxID=1105319 RepID=A0AAJ0CKR8_9HYPO|nr:hypothetical protein QQS21_008701 [Conoideocrella luteorostrata]